jgi:hypothetical protein
VKGGNYLVFSANAAAGQTNSPLIFTITNASPTVAAVFASLGEMEMNALTVIPDGRGQVTLTLPGNCFPLSARDSFRLYNSSRLDSTFPNLMGIGKQIRLRATLKAVGLTGED